MAAFFSITLSVSIVGIVSVLMLKRVEMKREHKLLGDMRPAIDRFFHRTLVLVEHVLPKVLKGGAMGAAYAVARLAQKTTHEVLHFFEGLLESLLERIRTQTSTPRSSKEASVFLREVSRYKDSVKEIPQKGHNEFRE